MQQLIIFVKSSPTKVNNFFEFQVDSEEEKLPDEKFVEDLSKNVPQGTDKTPEVLDSALKGLPDR
jgi:hypothetical protein